MTEPSPIEPIEPTPAAGRSVTVGLEGLLLVISFALLFTLAVLRDVTLFEPLVRSRLTLFTLAFLVLAVALIVAKREWMTLRSLARDWGALVAVLCVYESLKHLHANQITLWLGITPKDELMIELDRLLFGRVAPLWLDGLTSDGVVAVMRRLYSIGYYAEPVIVLAWLYLVRRDIARFQDLRRGIVLGLLGGYVLYILVPVAGPQFVMGDQFRYPLTEAGHVFTLVFDELRYQWDAFPSLHTAIPWVIVFLTWRASGWPGRVVTTGLALGITASTIVLRYHYGVDVVAGWLWAVAVAAGVATLRRRSIDPALVVRAGRPRLSLRWSARTLG